MSKPTIASPEAANKALHKKCERLQTENNSYSENYHRVEKEKAFQISLRLEAEQLTKATEKLLSECQANYNGLCENFIALENSNSALKISNEALSKHLTEERTANAYLQAANLQLQNEVAALREAADEPIFTDEERAKIRNSVKEIFGKNFSDMKRPEQPDKLRILEILETRDIATQVGILGEVNATVREAIASVLRDQQARLKAISAVSQDMETMLRRVVGE
jgi:hypothetical protein